MNADSLIVTVPSTSGAPELSTVAQIVAAGGAAGSDPWTYVRLANDFASETNGTTVTIKAGSFLKYRTIP